MKKSISRSASMVIVISVALMNFTPVLGQDDVLEKQVITFELNGKLVRGVPDEISLDYAKQAAITETNLDQKSGEMAALTLVPIESLHQVQSSLELSKDQIDDLTELRSEYSTEVAALDVADFDRVNKLKLKYSRKIGKILLPRQLKAFAHIADRRIRILSMLAEADNLTGVDLAVEQRLEFQQACETLRQPLEKILERHQKELEEHRSKMKEICNRILTEEQKKAISKNWFEPDDYIDYMNLKQMLDDVSSAK